MRAAADRHDDDVVVVGEGRDGGLVPARIAFRRPVRVAVVLVEGARVQDQVAGHAQDAGLPQARGPLVEDGERVVVVEAPGDVGVASADDEQRAEQVAVVDVAAAPERRPELVARARGSAAPPPIEIIFVTEAIVSGVAGLRSKTVSPVARSATAIETRRLARRARRPLVERLRRAAATRGVLSSLRVLRGRAARRGAGATARRAPRTRIRSARSARHSQIIIDRLRFDEESRVFEISVRELAEDEGFRRVGFDRGDGWRRLGPRGPDPQPASSPRDRTPTPPTAARSTSRPGSRSRTGPPS